MQNDKAKFEKLGFFYFAVMVLILSGCAAPIQKPMRVCPGREFAGEALSVLRSCSENAVPLKANGQCLLRYYAEGKRHKENFPVRLWVNPVRSPRQQETDPVRDPKEKVSNGADVRCLPSKGVNPPVEIYLQGDVAFDPKGIVLGSNEREFWLAIKLKEVSSYWWGEWSEESCFKELMISPELVLEAFGIAALVGEGKDEENWFLSNEGAFDVLTRRERSTETKKIYIETCDYLVRKIAYLDADGKAAAVTELDRYKEISEGFFVPTVVKIVKRAEDNGKKPVSITLSLKSVKSVSFTEKQKNRLFTRPEPHRFKHIFRIIDGETIEQAQ